MASLSTGSVNFPTSVYENSPTLITQLAEMMHERHIMPEIEVFDTSMVAPAVELKKKGLIDGPLYLNFVMGMRNVQPANIGQLSHLLTMIPDDALWSISGVGANQVTTMLLGLAAGGNVRVGLEDNLYQTKGVPAQQCFPGGAGGPYRQGCGQGDRIPGGGPRDTGAVTHVRPAGPAAGAAEQWRERSTI